MCNAYADWGSLCFVYLISFSKIRNFTCNTMLYTFNDKVYTLILHNFNIFSMIYTTCCIYRKITPDDEWYTYSKHVEDDYWNKLREGKKCILLVLITQFLSKCKSVTPAYYNIDNTSSYKSLITPGTCDFRCVKQGAGWQARSVLSISTVCTVALLSLPGTQTKLFIWVFHFYPCNSDLCNKRPKFIGL